MATQPSYCLEFALKLLFKTNFQMKEKTNLHKQLIQFVDNQHLVKNTKIKGCTMFQIYVTIATNTIPLIPSVKLPKNAIFRAIYLFSARIHPYYSYQFKIIQI